MPFLHIQAINMSIPGIVVTFPSLDINIKIFEDWVGFWVGAGVVYLHTNEKLLSPDSFSELIALMGSKQR